MRYNGKRDPENLDTTPIEMPLGACRPTPIQDLIARMVRQAIVEEKGIEPETWEESDDFEEEDPDTLDFSRYELLDIGEEPAIKDFNPDPDPVPPVETGDPPDPNAVEPDSP